ncbi:MAG: DUF459 domain-containing protein [Spirochaetales bacterium]|nr:DUF459 domain-containing protein [Spirochaetales bacterium]
MEKQNNKDFYKKQSLRQSLVLVLLIVALLVFVLSPLLVKWVNDLKDSHAKQIVHSLVDPIDEASEKLYLSWPLKNLRGKFRSFFLNDFSGPEGDFDRMEIAHLPVGEMPLYIRDDVFSSAYPLRILLLGDSMMKGSVAALFRRESSGYDYFEVSELSKISSGLSRPDFFNWPIEVEKLLSLRQFDLAVIMLGMNDAQSVESTGRYYTFGSDKWVEIYTSRVDDLVKLLALSTGQVYWIQLPPMRNKVFNDRMELINLITENYFASLKQGRYIYTHDILGKEGKYDDFLEVQGNYLRVRNSDGMHLSFEGARIVVKRLIEGIHDDFSFEVPLKNLEN